MWQSPPDPEPKRTVRRIAQVVKLKPEFVDKYKEVHAAVWPDVLRQIKDCNIQDYSIYHDLSTGILFATFKYVGHDYVGDMERMRGNPKVREWWAMTDGFQESMVPGAESSQSNNPAWWKELEEVFYLE
ncbi:rhamnose mutarotase [Annulohypoxylon maeteangense]|uniref:rhamnose mutarotase n=1 Tax=Annulohypoxylon maeteangense TaxID=1927788 RepID=UPI002008A2EB|nr:rhamnose mutarotase [Annulohypoxylon maeteangense]KAI0886100.1 rhamnose mutarotase [Annulohypoxylon maeteangense]